MLNPNELPEDTKNYLTELVYKNPKDLTPEEKAFLRARKDYLTREQATIFADVLAEAPRIAAPSDDTALHQRGAENSRKDLEAEAAELGLEFNPEFTDAQLKTLIFNAKFEKEAAEEDARLAKEEAEKKAKEEEEAAKQAAEKKPSTKK